MQAHQDQILPNIHQGNAIIVGVARGWALPGGDVTRNSEYALEVAKRMAKMMQGFVQENKA